MYNAANNNLSLSDNLFCTVRTVTLTVNSDGIPTSTAGFTIATTGTLNGCQVIRAINNTNSTVYPTGNPFITYTQNGTSITITQVAGIPANNSFSLTIIAWG